MLIYNPIAAKGNAGKILPDVQAKLSERGFDYELKLTDSPGCAQNLAKQAAEDGRQLIVVAGGDGTVNEVVNGLMLAELNEKERPVLAVLPVGRGNDFTFGVDIPQGLDEAIDVLIAGQCRRIDVGYVKGGDYPDGRFFCNGVGLGFDAVVGFEAAKIKWLHGAASYLAGVIRTLFLYAKAPVFEVVMDGETVTQPFLMVSVMNGRRMGGSFHMAPDGNASDGVFDLCLAGQVRQSRILPLAAKFISGTQKEHSAVRMAKAKQVSVRAVTGAIPAHADGETLCEAGQSLTINIFPDSLGILSLEQEAVK